MRRSLTCGVVLVLGSLITGTAGAAPTLSVVNPLEDSTSPPAAEPNSCGQGASCNKPLEPGYEPDPETPGNELLDAQDPALEQRAVPAEKVKGK